MAGVRHSSAKHVEMFARQYREVWIGVVIGLLATAVPPLMIGTLVEMLGGPRPEGGTRRDMARADVLGIEEALSLFAIQHGRLPSREEGLRALAPDQLDRVPVDPWGHPYVYQPENENTRAVSYGSDGKPGGEGTAADITRDSRDSEPWLWVVPNRVLEALLMGSFLIVPLLAYRNTGRHGWAVGALAGSATLFALAPLAVVGYRVLMPLGISAVFAIGAGAVLLRIRHSDGAVIGSMTALVTAFWIFSLTVVR